MVFGGGFRRFFDDRDGNNEERLLFRRVISVDEVIG